MHSKRNSSLIVDRTAVADNSTPATNVDLEMSVDEADTSEDEHNEILIDEDDGDVEYDDN